MTDDLVVSMEARAFTEDRTDPEQAAEIKDWLALAAVCGLCVLLTVV
jgi:energy-coupling factor transporter transmembrane protein EcfT